MTRVAVVGDSISAGSPLWDPDPAVRALIEEPDERSQWQWWAARADARLEFRTTAVYGERTDQIAGRLDLVLANLPYHAAARMRGPAASACREQPEHAIYAPGDGLQFNRDLIDACRTRLQERGAVAIQLYGQVLSAGRGELDQLLREIEARAAEGWEARVAADASGRGSRCCAWHASTA